MTDVFIVKDKFTDRSKGFAFVTGYVEAAQSATEQLNDFEFLGRNMVVNEARPKRSVLAEMTEASLTIDKKDGTSS